MPDNQVKIRVGADLAQADAALEAFSNRAPEGLGKTKESAQEIAAAFSTLTRDTLNANQAAALFGTQSAQHLQDVDKGLINAHQSTHLLAEQLGIHLPRAAVSGLSEILPSIGKLGGALLGVFAAKEVYEGMGKAADAIREMFTEADSEAKAFDAAASVAFKHAGDEAVEMLTHFKTSLAGTFQINELDARMAALERYHKAFMDFQNRAGGEVKLIATLGAETANAIADATKEGLNDLASVDKKINEVGQLQFDAHRQRAKVVQEESHAACEQAVKDAKAAKAAFDAIQGPDYTNTAFGTGKQQGYYAVAIQGMGKLKEVTDGSVVSLNLWKESMERSMDDLPIVGQHLNEMVHPLTQVNYAVREGMGFWKNAAAALDLYNKSTAKSVEANAQGAAALMQDLGLKREYAGFMTVYETAKGLEALGDWDLWGAAQDFASAAEYAKIAGSSGGAKSAPGGAGGGGGGGGAPGGNTPGASGGGGGGATPGSGTTIHLHMESVVATPDAIQQFFAQANALVKNGQVVMTATNALYNGEKLG